MQGEDVEISGGSTLGVDVVEELSRPLRRAEKEAI